MKVYSRVIGGLFKHLKNPSKEVQLAAVKKDGRNIRFIENPSVEVQVAAVNQFIMSIRFIEEPSICAQLKVIEIDGFGLRYIKDPPLLVQLASVKQNGWSINFIKNPSIEVQSAAVYDINKFFYHVNILSKDFIQIGCKTMTYDEWLQYESSFCEIVTNKLKELIDQRLKGE